MGNITLTRLNSHRVYRNPRPLSAAVLQPPRSFDTFQNIEFASTAANAPVNAPAKAPGTRLQRTCALTRPK